MPEDKTNKFNNNIESYLIISNARQFSSQCRKRLNVYFRITPHYKLTLHSSLVSISIYEKKPFSFLYFQD